MNPTLNIEGKTSSQKIEEAIELLISLGFIVQAPIECKSTVKSASGLVKFFYSCLAFYSPNLNIMYTGDKKKDLAIAKGFIQSRKDLGCSRTRAIEECCELIEFMFKYESSLGLKTKVTSMSVLGQDKMAWFSHNLINAYNGFNNEIEESKERIWFENLYDKQELSIGREQIETANRRLGLENENGEESS